MPDTEAPERWLFLHPPDRPEHERDRQIVRAYIRDYGPPPEDLVIEGLDYDRRVVLLKVRRRLPDGLSMERFTFAECSSEGWVVAKSMWLEPEARRRAELARVFMADWPAPPSTAVY
jgi:hypothetical protein